MCLTSALLSSVLVIGCYAWFGIQILQSVHSYKKVDRQPSFFAMGTTFVSVANLSVVGASGASSNIVFLQFGATLFGLQLLFLLGAFIFEFVHRS